MEELVVEKIIIPITECLPGMTLMQAVIDEHTGATIVGRGQILTEEIINKLQRFKHTQIWISINTESSVWKAEPEALRKYKSYAKILRSTIDQSKDGELDLKSIKDICDNMVQQFVEEYNILACMNLLNQLDKDDFTHSINVAFLCLLVGRWNYYSIDKLKQLVLSALLHDVGKILIKSELRHKNESLMELMEKLEYKRHPVYGYESLASYKEIEVEVLKGILSHHERCDGSGYPLSLRENKINDFAKIIGIIDTYDNLKRKHHIFELVQILTSRMVRKFDATLLHQFCMNVIIYYVGCSVLLNTGEIGEVTVIQEHALGKPIIKVKDESINLYEKTHLEIIKVL